MSRDISIASSWAVIAGVATLALAGCGQSPAPDANANTGVTPATEEAATADVARETELAARESELAAREAELAMKQKEEDLAKREAELAAKEKAAKMAAAPRKQNSATAPKPA